MVVALRIWKMWRSSAKLRTLVLPSPSPYTSNTHFFLLRPFTSSDDQLPPSLSDHLAHDSRSSSWSTGFSKDHFEGQAIGRQVDHTSHPPPAALSKWDKMLQSLHDAGRYGQGKNPFGNTLGDLMTEIPSLLKQAKEPGTRGSHLTESDKENIYSMHSNNPEIYTVEKLARDFKIMRQRVHAILWLKKDKAEMEKKLGHPLNNQNDVAESSESNCREFHVASLPYKPDFKVMAEDWDGMPKDSDEVHYEISKKEDEMLFEEFVQKFEFNMRKLKGEIKCHKYSRRREDNGWKITVEKLGPRGKRGSGGGWKFISLPDGSSRPLNELEKLFLKRETNKWRRKLLPRKSSRKMFAAA